MLNLENLTNSIKEYLYGIDDYEESAHELIGFIDRVCLIREIDKDSSCCEVSCEKPGSLCPR